jgi:HNH endonuclease
MSAERWQQTEYDGYDVSTRGRVRSWLKRGRGRHNGYRERPVMVRPYPSDRGYRRVSLSGREVYVACLVLETFRGPRPTGSQARHLNSRQQDNRLSNLKWGTPVENASDKCRSGVGCAKLTMSDRENIRRSRTSASKLARKYDVHPSTVYRIRQQA